MNILKIFRNKYLSFLLGITVLFYSCEIYDSTVPKKFSFEHYQNFKKNNLEFIEISKTNSILNMGKSISNPDLIVENLNLFLDEINQHYNTSIAIPNNLLIGIYNNRSDYEVKEFLKEENLMNENEIVTYENFVEKSKSDGFEQDVTNQNLTYQDFNDYNSGANTLKIINDQNPSLFEIDNNLAKNASGKWLCVLSYILWVVSLVLTLAACLGPQALFFCLGAAANFMRASYAVITDCAGHM